MPGNNGRMAVLEKIDPSGEVEIDDLNTKIRAYRPQYPGADIYFDGDLFGIVGIAPPKFGSWLEYAEATRKRRR